MARKDRTPEENARREKIRELLQMANIDSMDDIQELFKPGQMIGDITVIINHVNGPVPVSYIGSCDQDRVGKSKDINPNVQFYPRCFFPAS